MTSSITGRLVFADTRAPIHNLPIELLGRVPGQLRAPLGATVTDVDGRFSIPCPSGALDLALRGIETHRTYDEDGTPADTREEAFRLAAHLGDLGELPIAFWGYRPDRPVARADDLGAGRTDQQHAPGYQRVLERSIAQVAPITSGLVQRLRAGEPLTLRQIQAAYPDTLPQRIDRFGHHSRSDAWLGELVLNGFDTGLPCRDGDHLVVAYHWGEVPESQVHDLSDVELRLVEDGDGLRPVSIRRRTRRPGAWDTASWVEHVPGDPDWTAAKRVFRSAWLLSGALDAHIIRTHLLIEQFCIAAHRNLRRNPIRHLLVPHLQEVVAANTDADQFAWGPAGQIPNGSALSFPVVEERMRSGLGGMDWFGWRPRRPLTAGHKFAHVLELFWQLTERYVDDFVAAHHDDIVANWQEIRRFSDDLVRHSPVWRPPRPPVGAFYDASEVAREDAPRLEVSGVVRAMSPVTRSDAPDEGDLGNLTQLCRYLLTQATVFHTWVHDGQYDAGGDVLYASLALRNGSIGPETDDAIGPTVSEAINALTTNSNGLNANYGFLLSNEDGDVPPSLRSLVHEHAEAFAALGFDVRRIRSRINI